jgi:enterochelin esterase-like enzyme
MEYKGKLYGRIGKTYVEMKFSTDDIDAIQAENERLMAWENACKAANTENKRLRGTIETMRAENERLINFNIHLQETSAKYVWYPASTPPKHNGDVIAVLSDGTFFMARHNNISGWGFYFLDNGLQFDDTLGRNVTHWMPLSSLPSI